MSSSSSHAPVYSSAKTAAPWKAKFIDHVQNNMQSPEFVLSTLHPAPSGSALPYIPRARYCIFRGMWTELPENKHNEAPKNERVFESDMPTFTTDVRMEKVSELFATSKASEPESASGSGNGGPVEAVWWAKDVMTQWRVRGDAFVVGPDVEPAESESLAVKSMKAEVGKRMRVIKPGSEKDWSWSKELTGHFGNISPAARGSFKRPPPGRPTDEPYNTQEEEMNAKVTDLNEPVSRRNFRVVIIRPLEVEEVNLTPDQTFRNKYFYDATSDSWSTQSIWP